MLTLPDIRTKIESAPEGLLFQDLYGTDPSILNRQKNRFGNLIDLFSAQYPDQTSAMLFSVPGRSEIGGNHTDHQHGRCLCAAVNRDIIAAAAPNHDREIRLYSDGFSQPDCISIDSLAARHEERAASAALIRGIAAAFSQRGTLLTGLDIVTMSDVPKGSGLSSSAAFEILVASIIDRFCSQYPTTALELARIGHWAENVYFGKPCGLMDQCVCSIGGFLSIDFQDPLNPIIKPVAVDLEASGYDLILTDTGDSHADLTPEYASIPDEMRTIAAYFKKTALRDVPAAAIQNAWPLLRGEVSDRALLRAAHFHAENERVDAQAAALGRQDLSAFLNMARAGGYSSWMLLQNVSVAARPAWQPLAIALTAADRVLAGRGACRVHGGGFAGTIQGFVPKDLTAEYCKSQTALFGEGSTHVLRIRPLGAVSNVLGKRP